MAGRLVYEFGQDQRWESEVIAMLEVDREGVLMSDGDGDFLGNRIVGSSVAQIQDNDVRDLFGMFAVVPEDVPVPMPALELLWCAHRGEATPLSRLELIRLRRRVFELLDRNLLLGESVTGVYMVRLHPSLLGPSRMGLSLSPQHYSRSLRVSAFSNSAFS